jgi:2-dehydropantoate 2-reductase
LGVRSQTFRITIFGAGAVGSHFAVRLAGAGHEVAVIARGAHLDAIRQRGLTLRSEKAVQTVRVLASDDPRELGPQDFVIVTLKAPALRDFATACAPLLQRGTGVVFAQNGIPWWYNLVNATSRPRAPDLTWLDPDNLLASTVGPERTLGGVVYSSNEVVAPAEVVNRTPNRNVLYVGELDDRQTVRIASLRAALRDAGIESPDVPDLRAVMWQKLMENMTISIVCLLTGLTERACLQDPSLGGFLGRLIEEAHQIATAHGYPLPFDPSAPLQGGDHKPSILQDYERRRPLELDALVRAPLAFARAAQLDTPTLDVVSGLAIQRAVMAGLYSSRF